MLTFNQLKKLKKLKLIKNKLFFFFFLLVGFGFCPLQCWSVFVSAGRARPAPTSLVTTLVLTLERPLM